MQRLYRSKKDAKLAGICGGIGEILDIDPTIVRLVLVLADLMTGIIPFVVAYLVGWIIIPEKDDLAGQ